MYTTSDPSETSYDTNHSFNSESLLRARLDYVDIPAERARRDADGGADVPSIALDPWGCVLKFVPAFVVDLSLVCENSFESKFQPRRFESRYNISSTFETR